MLDMIMYSTSAELEEVVDAMTWMSQPRFGPSCGIVEVFLTVCQSALLLKKDMEKEQASRQEAGGTSGA
jgi:hypothetical protein